MQNLLPIDFNALTIKCDIISREIQDWRSICSNVTEHAKWLISAEVCNLTYPQCRMKLEEILGFLSVVISHQKVIEELFLRSSDLRRILMHHDHTRMLLKKLLEEELHLLDLMRNLGEAQISLLQYDNKLTLHEISLYI
ncbi:hypothetical protein CDAR_616391 [Caerostris darwini]|uniref:Uncharacterized protein n=1 Tax=Caerostris darwini TaxID=1538125 RepID=A0AAV4NGY0_9ARAC|nr:hypothetical protein CDAR_616391 [Caerostris darwini]